MMSPRVPKLDLSSTWLLLRISGRAISARVHRLPMVPMQHEVELVSVLLPPEVPSFTGVDCDVALSLGYTTVALADAVCARAVAVTVKELGVGKVAGAG